MYIYNARYQGIIRNSWNVEKLSACANSGYQALFSDFSNGPGYEAMVASHVYLSAHHTKYSPGTVRKQLARQTYFNDFSKYLPELEGECISLLLQQTVALLCSLQTYLHLSKSPAYKDEWFCCTLLQNFWGPC